MDTNLQSSFPDIVQAVFLDRDGVLNEKMPEGRYVTCWNEFQVLPGVVEAIRLLNQARMRVIVVSNQRGIALGLYAAEDVLAIHEKLQYLLQAGGAHVDGFFFCPHDLDQCNCRKPLPGMFEQAVANFPEITAAHSLMIGDSESDMDFGQRLGMITALIDAQADSRPGEDSALKLADLHYGSLYEAVCDLLAMLRDPIGARITRRLGLLRT